MTDVDKPLGWFKAFGFEESNFAFQAAFALGQVYDGCGDIGEVLETCYRIKDSDVESWYREWKKTADRVFAVAETCEKKGHKISAGEAYQKASSYYDISQFYKHEDPKDAEALDAARKAVYCFQKAMQLLNVPVEIIRIPYEESTLPGYFYKSPVTDGKRPLVIVQSGFDGTAEDLYGNAMAAMKRGYNCLIFEGPGQGQVLREQNLLFRHDWETVITPVIDYAESRPDVDTDKMAVIGYSMGGYLVPRAACFEHRPKAFIANGGVYDFSAAARAAMGPEVYQLVHSDPDAFNAAMMEAKKGSVVLNWALNDSKWKLGGESYAATIKEMEKYALNDDLLSGIRSHMLICDAEAEDIIEESQAKTLFDAIPNNNKEYLLFTVEETAEAHCQPSAFSVLYQRTFDWLDEFFDNQV